MPLAASAWSDWAAWGGVSGRNSDDIEPLARAGVRGFKCFLAEPGIDGFCRVDEAELRAAAPHLARTGLPLLVHAELPEFLAPADPTADPRRYDTWLRSRPDQAEVEAIRLMIGLCREYGFRLHIVHLATAEALPDIRQAKDEGLPLTVEICPHYLHFAAEDIPDGSTLHKCAPPIRSAANREQLWQAIKEGAIDLIATDHSPCPPEMKHLDTGNFLTAWGGIASVSVALPVVWTGLRDSWLQPARCGPAFVTETGTNRRTRRPQRRDRPRLRRRFCRFCARPPADHHRRPAPHAPLSSHPTSAKRYSEPSLRRIYEESRYSRGASSRTVSEAAKSPATAGISER